MGGGRKAAAPISCVVFVRLRRFLSPGWLVKPSLQTSASTRPNVDFCQNQTFRRTRRNDDNCEGFRALAYESLQCRNPRAPRADLWVNRLWDGSGGCVLSDLKCASGRISVISCGVRPRAVVVLRMSVPCACFNSGMSMRWVVGQDAMCVTVMQDGLCRIIACSPGWTLLTAAARAVGTSGRRPR
jgi:hypothetical protein